MYIEQISESKIKVTVDVEDQEKYGITYETMDYEDANTRRLCEKIISEAQSEIGFDSRNSRILVEARNGSKGNITIFISKIPKYTSWSIRQISATPPTERWYVPDPLPAASFPPGSRQKNPSTGSSTPRL